MPKVINPPDLKVIVHTPPPEYRDTNIAEQESRALQHGIILTRQEQQEERSGGLYIRLVLRQEGRQDLVWLYKTHKF